MSAADDDLSLSDFCAQLNTMNTKDNASSSPLLNKKAVDMLLLKPTDEVIPINYDKQVKKLEDARAEREDRASRLNRPGQPELNRDDKQIQPDVDLSKQIQDKLARGGGDEVVEQSLSIVQIHGLREWLQDYENQHKFLRSRHILQRYQLKNAREKRALNQERLEELKNLVQKTYGLNLDDIESRRDLPEDVKERFYNRYVTRKDVDARLIQIEKNLETDMLQYEVWLSKKMDGGTSQRNLNKLIVDRRNRMKEVLEKTIELSTANDKAEKDYEDKLASLKFDNDPLTREDDESESEWQERLLRARMDFRQKFFSRNNASGLSTNNVQESPQFTQLDSLKTAADKAKKEFEDQLRVEEIEKFKQNLFQEMTDPNTNDNQYVRYFKSIEKYLEKIQGLTALDTAKGQIAADIVTLIFDPLRYGKEHFNMALLGHPGTGKTNLVKYIAPLYKLVGIVPNADKNIEKYEAVAPNALQSSFQAATAVRTEGVLLRYAVGGLLFIDEAYGFGQGGSRAQDKSTEGGASGAGAEAITQMTDTTEEFKGLMFIVVAGYEDLMQRFFFDLNPGLNSRFPRRIMMQDYTADELFEMFERLANPQLIDLLQPSSGVLQTVRVVLQDVRFKLSSGAQRKLKAVFQTMKDFDEVEEKKKQEHNDAFFKRIEEIQQKIAAIRGRPYDRSNLDELDYYSKLLDTELHLEANYKEDAVKFDRRLFATSNARGVFIFFGLCETAWSARKFRAEQGNNPIQIEREFIEEDISKATYQYTKNMLGLNIDWIDDPSAAAHTPPPGSVSSSSRGGGGGVAGKKRPISETQPSTWPQEQRRTELSTENIEGQSKKRDRKQTERYGAFAEMTDDSNTLFPPPQTATATTTLFEKLARVFANE